MGFRNNVIVSLLSMFITYKGENGDIMAKKPGRHQHDQVTEIRGWDRNKPAWMRLQRHHGTISQLCAEHGRPRAHRTHHRTHHEATLPRSCSQTMTEWLCERGSLFLDNRHWRSQGYWSTVRTAGSHLVQKNVDDNGYMKQQSDEQMQ